MEYKFSSNTYRKIFLFFSPFCFLFWIAVMKFIISDEASSHGDIVRAVIFFSILFLPGGPVLAFYGLDMDYEVRISHLGISHTKNGLFNNGQIQFSFSEITEVQETFFGSLIVKTTEGKILRMVKYLTVDYEGLSALDKKVFDALEVHPSSKVVSFIKLLLISRIGETDSFQPNHKEMKAYRLLEK